MGVLHITYPVDVLRKVESDVPTTELSSSKNAQCASADIIHSRCLPVSCLLRYSGNEHFALRNIVSIPRKLNLLSMNVHLVPLRSLV